MESKKIYEESGNEIARIRKTMGADSFTVNSYLLDGYTKEALLKAMNAVLSERAHAIEKVTLGVQ